MSLNLSSSEFFETYEVDLKLKEFEESLQILNFKLRSTFDTIKNVRKTCTETAKIIGEINGNLQKY